MLFCNIILILYKQQTLQLELNEPQIPIYNISSRTKFIDYFAFVFNEITNVKLHLNEEEEEEIEVDLVLIAVRFKLSFASNFLK